MDVKTAFLNGDLDEEVYIKQPKGFVMPGNEHKVCKLVKSLYGLKQAPKQWHQKFDEVVLSSDMGEADIILGIKIKRENKGIVITQSHYIEKILKKFIHEHCSPVSTPMDPVEKLKPNTGKPVDHLEYSRAIGCLMYAMTSTRPDIAYAVGRLSSSDASWIKFMLKIHLLLVDGCFCLGGGAISWAFKKQTCITSSTMEYEFVAWLCWLNEAEWLRNLIHENSNLAKLISTNNLTDVIVLLRWLGIIVDYTIGKSETLRCRSKRAFELMKKQEETRETWQMEFLAKLVEFKATRSYARNCRVVDVVGIIKWFSLGAEMGVGFGAKLRAEMGVEMGAKMGVGLGAEMGVEMWVHLGAKIGNEVGAFGAEVGLKLTENPDAGLARSLRTKWGLNFSRQRPCGIQHKHDALSMFGQINRSHRQLRLINPMVEVLMVKLHRNQHAAVLKQTKKYFRGAALRKVG
ncbi:zinc finger, CCHC-type containing protein [Tanacetum coccineum]